MLAMSGCLMQVLLRNPLADPYVLGVSGGAAFATFAGVARDKFRYLAGESDLTVYASSDNHNLVFCGVCGSNILVELTEEPDDYYLSMSASDGDPPRPTVGDPSSARPIQP